MQTIVHEDLLAYPLGSDPWFGSVKPKQPTNSPVAKRGKNCIRHTMHDRQANPGHITRIQHHKQAELWIEADACMWRAGMLAQSHHKRGQTHSFTNAMPAQQSSATSTHHHLNKRCKAAQRVHTTHININSNSRHTIHTVVLHTLSFCSSEPKVKIGCMTSDDCTLQAER